MDTRRHRGLVRWAAVVVGIGLAIVATPIVALAAFALTSPYQSAAIPASCSAAGPRMPADRADAMPGVGIGTLLASSAGTRVIVANDQPQSPTALAAFIVDARSNTVVRRISIASGAVVAAISDGVVYLFDDKTGYVLDASTGRPLPRLVEVDNYRGLFTAGGTSYLQTDAEIVVLFGRSPFSHVHPVFAGIAAGCFVPAPG